ncbi:hypothetical protein CHUAL_004161 [Chamberlinius hualienensis]
MIGRLNADIKNLQIGQQNILNKLEGLDESNKKWIQLLQLIEGTTEKIEKGLEDSRNLSASPNMDSRYVKAIQRLESNYQLVALVSQTSGGVMEGCKLQRAHHNHWAWRSRNQWSSVIYNTTVCSPFNPFTIGGFIII